jgi:two-component system, LuxR family, sensor kinase FixL
LIQVISNLLSDAMKFAKEREGGEGTITIIAEKKDNQGQVVVSVNDTDECIRSETLSKLFKFASNPFEGTGLGLLFIAKSIIEAHGGKIRVENNNNIDTHREKRATFYFTLPIIDQRLNVKLVVDQW